MNRERIVRQLLPVLSLLIAALILCGCIRIEKIESPETGEQGNNGPAQTEVPETDAPETEAPETDETEPPEKPEPPEAPPAEDVQIDEDTLAHALALALVGHGKQYLDEADGLRDAIGYYAALLARITAQDAAPWLSDAACEAAAALLRPDEELPPLSSLLSSDGVTREELDGQEGYLFTAYETQLNESLGIYREISETLEDGTYILAVVDHPEGGTETTLVYAAFADDPSAGVRKLVYLVVTDPRFEPDKPDFTLDLLRERNRISALLSEYSCVTVDMSDEYSVDHQAFWLRDGDRVFYEVNEANWDDEEGNPQVYRSEIGNYRGFSFNMSMAAEPILYLWVEKEPGQAEDEAYYEEFLLRYIPEDNQAVGELTLIAETDDSYVLTAKEEVEYPEMGTFRTEYTYTAAKDTLAFREIKWTSVSPNGESLDGGFTAAYNGEKLGEDVLRAWDETRAVTVDIKTAAGARTETVSVPDGWFLNLIVDEGVTVYRDEGLTEPTYNYVESHTGDLVLYARDEENTVRAGADGGQRDAFTLEDVIEANRITSLLRRYGQAVRHGTSDGHPEDTVYFRSGDRIVQIRETDEMNWSGTRSFLTCYYNGPDTEQSIRLNVIDGVIRAAGSFALSDRYDPAPPEALARYADAEGEYYEENLSFVWELEGGTMEIIGETEDAWSILVTVTRDWDPDYRKERICLVEKDTLALRSIKGETDTWTFEYGEGIAAFAEDFDKAMETVRTVTVHAVSGGNTTDHVFRIPASWEFKLDLMEALTYYADAGYTQPIGNLIPADGQTYEIWAVNAQG